MMSMRSNWRTTLRCVQDSQIIGRLPALTEIGETIISRLLPQMERLVNVELPECEDRTNLLKALLAHPTVALVLVDQTPSMAMCNHDLSKVTLDLTTSAMAFSLICHKYLDWGMRIKRVILDRPVGNQLEFQKVPGLKSIEVSMHFVPISILSSCLSPFLSTHPTLNELRLFYLHRPFFTHDAPPFLSPLIKDYQRQGLHDCFMITELRLSRIKSAGQSSQEWHVMELALDVKSSLTEKLPLVASSFPKLEVLHLNLQYDKGMYDIVRFISFAPPLTQADDFGLRMTSLLHSDASHLLASCIPKISVAVLRSNRASRG
ncbi:hypothetical protein F5880DRAFT_1554227 [Lentinula raphanica]|nr:hypothetical protein F5880DRAFT_1554227 [Lentinula raphanica]